MANQIAVNEYFITITIDVNDALFASLFSAIPALFPARKQDTYHCSLIYLPEVLKTLRNITDVNQLTGKIKRLYQEELDRRYYTPLLKKYGTSLTDDVLWPQQLLGIELAEVNRRYGFFYDTRTGKTLLALHVMYNALKAGKATRCLVICPSGIIHSWLEDAAKHFPDLKVVAYYGTNKQKAHALGAPSHIIIWSMEQFVKNIDLISKLKFDICFVDESSKLKSHRSQISKTLRKFSLTVPSWYLLSATPAPNDESEYYTQMMTIDPFIFNPARGKFVSRYFNDYSRTVMYEQLVIRPDMYESFMQKIKERAIYVDQSVMPTAGKEWHLVEYDLPDYAKIVYNSMKKGMALTVEDTTITVEMAAAMRAKLSQITSGFVMDTEAIRANKMSRKLDLTANLVEVYPIVKDGDYSRIEELQRLLLTLGDQQVVIWANYKEEFRMLQNYFGNKAHYIRGGCSVANKELFIKEFKAGKVQYIVCHPLSVGMGINLSEAHVAIYYSLNDSWEALKQSSERIMGHISIQPNKCHFYVLVAKGTIDEVIYKDVQNKRDTSLSLLEHLRAEAL